MTIDEEDLPDIIDVVPDDYPDDGDDEEKSAKKWRDIERYIKKHRITPKNYRRRKDAHVKALRSVIKDLTMQLYAEAYQQRQTYQGWMRKQDVLRRGVFRSLLAGLPVDAKIIIIQELLRELEGDDEPTTYYIA